ncbi:hypothetical protein BDQ12DRAFT_667838 [Crucibulum laeve]|uniref:Uncharacterized protein n=1 Tax=Crucibulum laeve TaxID=68775 RepID=A0A5C3LWZ8_9AGAR|nr:hypothetical protein BDQ12DRAFT_667838 [Crucibulum laeve]
MSGFSSNNCTTTKYHREIPQATLTPRDGGKRNLHLEHYSGVILTVSWANVWFTTYIIIKGKDQWLPAFPNYSFALLIWELSSVFFIPLLAFGQFQDNELLGYEMLKFPIIFTIEGLFSIPFQDAQQFVKLIGPVLLWFYSLASCFVATLIVHNHYVRIQRIGYELGPYFELVHWIETGPAYKFWESTVHSSFMAIGGMIQTFRT